ncbi:MAG TPA: hypothetical protein VNG51_03275 [Ktedonobacteraceae bacterium]|nr:hypothetical protein [Ktedonobacteraceae bacterium]
MAESVTQHGTDHSDNDEPEAVRNEQATDELVAGLDEQTEQLGATPPETIAIERGKVVWTPKFIILFALTLAIGLSADSVLTQGWVDGFYRAIWVLFGNLALLLGLWIGAAVIARSWWVRMGAIFGCVWALFSIINLVTMLFNFDLRTAVPAYLNATFSCALLGAYICFSTAYCELRRWDIWCFRLAMLIGFVFILVGLLFPSSSASIPAVLATDIGTIAAILSILVWWVRPSCWRTHAGLTFFFGASPAIALLLSLPNITNARVNFFLTQVSLLCLILALMRIIQSERVQ